jgi:hypothetical protein
MPDAAFDPEKTYVHLADGPDAVLLEVGDDFWEQLPRRTDLPDGRLLAVFRFEEDWATREVHPAGDELVVLLSGAVDLVLFEESGERVVPLRGRGACLVPRGVWHTARVHEPSEVLHVTRGAGTRHEPL